MAYGSVGGRGEVPGHYDVCLKGKAKLQDLFPILDITSNFVKR